VLAYELATKSRDECCKGFTSTTSADVSPQSFEAEMHDDVIRSPKESRLFERTSSDEVRDQIDSRWYELVLACDGGEQLARERVFAALPLAIKVARYQSLN
jgi:hypothetical protein